MEFLDNEGPENIWVASSDGDITRVQEILSPGLVNVNQQDDNGYSPMYAFSNLILYHDLLLRSFTRCL